MRSTACSREGLLVEARERIWVSLPFDILALDGDNGGESLKTMIEHCPRHGTELTRSRP
jgi:hypothetical protein